MTNLYFTACLMPPKDEKNPAPVRMFMSASAPTRTDNPGDERRAVKEAMKVISGLVTPNEGEEVNDDPLLCDGPMPVEAAPIFTFAIAVAYDRANHMGHYKYIDCATLRNVVGVGRVSSEMIDVKDEIMACLAKYERKMRDYLAERYVAFLFDYVSVVRCREAFEDYAKKVAVHQEKRRESFAANRLRFDCERLRNGYCSPAKPDCPCYECGKCVEREVAEAL